MILFLLLLALSVVAAASGRWDWAAICLLMGIACLGCWALGRWARGGDVGAQ